MLEIKNIYAKSKSGALCGVSTAVEEKGIYGIIGANKGDLSVLAEAICGCCDLDSGCVELNGQPVVRGDRSIRRKVRLVPEVLKLTAETTSGEYLSFVGDVFKIEAEKKYRLVKEAMEFVGLDEKADLRFDRLGSCDRFRLSLAAALIGNPECIVISNSLVHVSPAEFLAACDTVKSLGRLKTVILISSSASVAKKLCSRVDIMCGGKIVLSGGVEEIEKKINTTREVNVTVRGEIDRVISVIKEKVDSVIEVKISSVKANSVNTLSIECRPDTKIKEKLYNALSEINAPMLSYRELVLTLDDVFFSLTASDKQKGEHEALAEKTDKKKGGDDK